MQNFLVDVGLNIIGKKVKRDSSITGLGLTLINNELKDIKVIMYLENRGILLTGTTRKINSQEEKLLNSYAPLTRVALHLMKNVLAPLAKSVWVLLGLTAAASATDAAIQKKFWIRHDIINNFK